MLVILMMRKYPIIKLRNKLHSLAKLQIPQIMILNHKRPMIIIEHNLTILILKVIDPQQLESLQTPHANSQIGSLAHYDPIIAGPNYLLDLLGVVHAVVDEDVLV